MDNKTDCVASSNDATQELIRLLNEDRYLSLSTEKIESLIKDGADVNATTTQKWSVLMIALTRRPGENTDKIVACLKENKADIHYGIDEYSVLSRAAHEHSLDTIKMLCDEETTVSNLNQALNQSLFNDDKRVLEFFLNKGAIITDSELLRHDDDILQLAYKNDDLIARIQKDELMSLEPKEAVAIATRKGFKVTKEELKELYPHLVDSYVSTRVTLLENEQDVASFCEEYGKDPIIKNCLSDKTKSFLKLVNPRLQGNRLPGIKEKIAENEHFRNNLSAQNTALLEYVNYDHAGSEFNERSLHQLTRRLEIEKNVGKYLSPEQRSALWDIVASSSQTQQEDVRSENLSSIASPSSTMRSVKESEEENSSQLMQSDKILTV